MSVNDNNFQVLVSLPGSRDYSSVVIGSDRSEIIETGDQEQTVNVSVRTDCRARPAPRFWGDD